MSKQFYFKQFSLALVRSLNVKTDLFQAIKFSISTQFSSVWSIDRTLSDASTLGWGGPGSDGNEGVLCILQSSSITGTSPSDCLVSYPEHSLGEVSYISAEKQSAYSNASANWAIKSFKKISCHQLFLHFCVYCSCNYLLCKPLVKLTVSFFLVLSLKIPLSCQQTSTGNKFVLGFL